ncbi:MAG: hypothetical protein EOO54_03745 [Haliea sp.]|nr:MAG: hypothetical protein EOO54_03745 [Haliea sp.]
MTDITQSAAPTGLQGLHGYLLAEASMLDTMKSGDAGAQVRKWAQALAALSATPQAPADLVTKESK